MIYLDFAKAFDSVDHKILVTKLCAHGIPGKLLSWFVNYFSSRVQRVVLEGASWHWAPVTSGVPQWSLQGPLMFVTFINNLPDAAKGQVNTALYANESKIFGAVKCARDCEAVQSTLSNIDKCRRCNNIQFNTSKCKFLIVTRKKQPFTYDYTLDNAQLKHVAEREGPWNHRGTSTLSWLNHVNAIVSKANKLLGLLKRTCPR